MSPLAAELLDVARRVWWDAHGLPYRWGGDDPGDGFDCSGLVIEGLRSCGILPRTGDWTAADLAQRFPLAQKIRPGCLLFWGEPRVTHVEIVWELLSNGLVLTLGASGGGSKTLTRADAIAQNAFVKLRPARTPWVRAVDPFAAEVTA